PQTSPLRTRPIPLRPPLSVPSPPPCRPFPACRPSPLTDRLAPRTGRQQARDKSRTGPPRPNRFRGARRSVTGLLEPRTGPEQVGNRSATGRAGTNNLQSHLPSICLQPSLLPLRLGIT